MSSFTGARLVSVALLVGEVNFYSSDAGIRFERFSWFKSCCRDSTEEESESLGADYYYELMALELKLALFQLGLRGSLQKLWDRLLATF